MFGTQFYVYVHLSTLQVQVSHVIMERYCSTCQIVLRVPIQGAAKDADSEFCVQYPIRVEK